MRRREASLSLCARGGALAESSFAVDKYSDRVPKRAKGTDGFAVLCQLPFAQAGILMWMRDSDAVWGTTATIWRRLWL